MGRLSSVSYNGPSKCFSVSSTARLGKRWLKILASDPPNIYHGELSTQNGYDTD